MISADQVKALREKTGAGMMECKQALTETNGDMTKAEEVLRKKGVKTAEKKAGNIAAEGAVGSYIHMGGKIGVLVEINSQTDFAAKGEEFQELVRDVAMHIAAANPRWIRREEVPPEVVAKEKEIAVEVARKEGKPDKILEKIAEGKVVKFYEENCLLEQKFVKDQDKTVQQMLTDKIAKIRENLSIRRFARFQLGEGIEKKTGDFAKEVAAAAGH
ncbi:MAG: translation elongation factor Ts [Deltaproteobacteria bacterium]|nr:translation elongation factor Ts [Deltaproteobacteria bacterium]